ncbi:MAG: NAD(P)/FAD-dependent oxidoreductase [Candidatus Omnitrophica bacterium]|nr:NAD(P)/FAD-dependent oxidoreductase [Candidatus Omnitrophota bacterium]
MERYQSIIVGGGVSGMTLALLLAANGRKVLLLEKAPVIGGGLCRFRKNGIPFDTGFHFTGGFVRNTILRDMLTVLGINDSIRPVLLDKERSNQFLFEQEGITIAVPAGIDVCCARFEEYFPADRAAVKQYFAMVDRVIQATPSFDLRKIAISPDPIKEDFVTLQHVLDGLTQNKMLQAALSVYCMCYGTRPNEVSFANHARVAVGFYDAIARVEDGGDAFIRAFRQAFKDLPIEVRCHTTILECLDIHDRQVGRFLLSSGEEVTADECIFTIHPHEVLKVLPRQHFSKAFWDRVEAFEASNGFFSVFGAVDGAGPGPEVGPSLMSVVPQADINRLMDPSYDGPQALAIFQSREMVRDRPVHVVTAFEPSYFQHVAPWQDSKVGRRSSEYAAYKDRHAAGICDRIRQVFPQYKDSFKMVDAASMLTFRDYLSTPDGSAYGIRQKVGQFNLFGRLPLRNLYAAGQSAVLPGILGAMLSSFVVARSIVDQQQYNDFVSKRLCH